MDFSDYIIYVDESGDHGLRSIDNGFPVFVLACCVFRKDQYAGDVVPAVQRFKFKHFGHDLAILHERDIRKKQDPFLFLTNEEKRAAFMDELTALIRNAPFTVIASVIDKRKLLDKYRSADNPYEIALRFCMERAYAFLKDHGQKGRATHMVVERRGAREDDELELAFRRIRDGDNNWGPMACLQLAFAHKQVNSAGLQLADLIARPIGRSILNTDQNNRAFAVIAEKIRKSPSGRKEGWGLKVFP